MARPSFFSRFFLKCEEIVQSLVKLRAPYRVLKLLERGAEVLALAFESSMDSKTNARNLGAAQVICADYLSPKYTHRSPCISSGSSLFAIESLLEVCVLQQTMRVIFLLEDFQSFKILLAIDSCNSVLVLAR